MTVGAAGRAEAVGGPRPTLVTGGTGALGIHVLRRLLDAGQHVTATWLGPAAPARMFEELGRPDRLTLVRADVTDPESVQALVGDLPGLGAVVNLVGGYAAGPRVHETAPPAFQAMLSLNLTPSFLLARSAMPLLVAGGGGAFVSVSSRAALRPFAGAAGYITAKAALIALVQALDVEYRDAGVRCNVVIPSTIDTPANRQAQPAADFSRWVAPAQIADVVAFLLTPQSSAVTGAAVPVYGCA